MPRGGWSQSSKFPKFQKSDWALIYSRAPLHIQNLSFWLKDLYPYSIRLFESNRSKVEVANCASGGSESKFKIFKISKIWLSPNLFPGLLTHSEGLLLAQSSLSIQYSTFQVRQVKSGSCQLCLGGWKTKFKIFKSAKISLSPNLFPGPLTHSEPVLLAQRPLSIQYSTF